MPEVNKESWVGQRVRVLGHPGGVLCQGLSLDLVSDLPWYVGKAKENWW